MINESAKFMAQLELCWERVWSCLWFLVFRLEAHVRVLCQCSVFAQWFVADCECNTFLYRVIKSLCAPEDYGTKNAQKYCILNRIHSECGPCYTEHGLREHSSA